MSIHFQKSQDMQDIVVIDRFPFNIDFSLRKGMADVIGLYGKGALKFKGQNSKSEPNWFFNFLLKAFAKSKN